MLASIPEPQTAVLLVFAILAASVVRRRCQRIFLLMVGTATLVAAQTASAGILEDFPFNDANGTILAGAANTANPGNFWFEDPDMTNSSVLNGVYRVQKDNLNFGSNGLDIVDVTAGTVWMVAEFGGWAFTSDVIGGDEEEVRFTFLNNASPDPPGSTITAQMEIERIDTGGGTGRLEINGQALGTGGTNISPVTLNLVQNDPFTMVLELNKTNSQYSIFFKDGANDFVPLGTANVEPTRNGNTVRMVFNNDFSDGPGEFVDLDRFYITDESPLGQIELLGINVHETTGEVTIANDAAGSSFDIDYYRISSATGELNFNLWNSLDDQNFDAIGPGVGESWDEAGGSNDNVLAEAYLLSSSQFDPNDAISIGNVFRAGAVAQSTDLIFEYRDAATGNVFTGDVNLVNGGVDGDFNTDGSWDCNDVDALVVEIVNTTNDPSFDMNGDGSVDQLDLQRWLIVGGVNNPDDTGGNAFLAGDATLDGIVDGLDFIEWNNNKFTSLSAWCGGDFTADGIVDGLDFIEWNNNKFQSSDANVAGQTPSVPEPSGGWLILVALFTLFAGRRSRGLET